MGYQTYGDDIVEDGDITLKQEDLELLAVYIIYYILFKRSYMIILENYIEKPIQLMIEFYLINSMNMLKMYAWI